MPPTSPERPFTRQSTIELRFADSGFPPFCIAYWVALVTRRRATATLVASLFVIVGADSALGQDASGSSAALSETPLGLWSWSRNEPVDSILVIVERDQGGQALDEREQVEDEAGRAVATRDEVTRSL